MSKDLENEYRQLIADDTPDLWARIEAGLEPKKKKKKPVRFWTFAAVAAACACVVITLPAIMMSGGYSSDSTSSGSTASNNSASASSDSAPMYSASDGMDTAAAQGDAGYGKAQMSGGVDNSVLASAAETVAEEVERDYESEVGIGIEVYVQILEVTEEDDTIVYLARIETSEGEALAEGAEIKIYSDSDDGELLEAGERCELRLVQLETDEELPAFYKQND